MSAETHAEQLEKLELFKKIGELERENRRLKNEIERLEYALVKNEINRKWDAYLKMELKP